MSVNYQAFIAHTFLLPIAGTLLLLVELDGFLPLVVILVASDLRKCNVTSDREPLLFLWTLRYSSPPDLFGFFAVSPAFR